MIAQQVAAEGVKRIVVVTDEPDKYPPRRLRARRHASTTATSSTPCSASCARCPGVTVLHLRPDLRRREAPPPQARQVSRPAEARRSSTTLVCEGCGDCGVQSNCVSVAPVETEFGRKRTIDQSSCNKDFSLREGLLPELRHRRGRRAAQAAEGRRRSSFRGAARRRRCRALAAAVRHPRHRHRRHRRGHDRRAARHGRAPRGQGLHRARHDRPRAEERRGRVARAHRRHARAAARGAHRRRRGRRWCSAATSVTGVGYEALAKMQKGVTTRARQHGAGDAARSSRATPTCEFPTGRRWSRRSRTPSAPGDAEFVDATKLATGAHGRLDRDQPVHGRLRVPARAAAACREAAILRRSS